MGMDSLINAFAYLRVSGKAQVGGDGFPRQRAAINSYALAHGITIIRWFEERGISGSRDLDNRPALRDLMIALHSNGTKTVLIEKLDRLARDLMVQETIIGDLRKNGFELLSVAEPDLCSDDPSRKLVRQVFGAISEYERSMIVLKLRGARERSRAKNGRCEGRKPYGHTPEETAVIRRMHELRGQGLNDVQIADTLTNSGLRPRKAAAWSSAVVGRILERLVAAGSR
jgi:DNA invertase Pin-like site-specific DNA recombinase